MKSGLGMIELLRQIRNPIHRNDRVGALSKAWGYVFNNHLRGDYYEFGVFRGESLISSFKAYRRFRKWLEKEAHCSEEWRRTAAERFVGFEARFHGFDTFEGMPENNESNPIFARGTFPASIEAVKQRCHASGLSGKQLQLFPGLFSSSSADLSKSDHQPAAIINLDCDLYASAKDALAISETLIQDGTVLLCDDFNTYSASPDQGERRALAEFCESVGIEAEPWFPYQYCAQAFICHR